MNVMGIFRTAREFLTPVLQQSAFLERGMLTPEEFRIAGDHLVHTCPTWSWGSGDERLRKSYLPADKQFLVTRSVPSFRRAVDLLSESGQATLLEESESGNEAENWYTPSTQQKKNQDDDGIFVEATEMKQSIQENNNINQSGSGSKVSQVEKSNEYDDIENYEDSSLTLDADATVAHGSGENEENGGVIHCRRYDVYICYDNYYRTPRVYLFGYDDTSSHHPLSPERIMEDIIQDYINKTVTIEPHPHFTASTPTASIHPCQHANAMKRIIEEMMSLSVEENGGEEKQAKNEKTSPETNPPHPTVNQYLFIFLKFLQSVIPTIEYDYTIDVQIKRGGR